MFAVVIGVVVCPLFVFGLLVLVLAGVGTEMDRAPFLTMRGTGGGASASEQPSTAIHLLKRSLSVVFGDNPQNSRNSRSLQITGMIFK